jgi:hypothetical protein
MTDLVMRVFQNFALGPNLECFIHDRDRGAVGCYVTMRSIEAGEPIPSAFTLDKTAAQVLMDDLWHAGIRPTEGSGSAGSLAATERHLADMRRIVEKSLKMEMP